MSDPTPVCSLRERGICLCPEPHGEMVFDKLGAPMGRVRVDLGTLGILAVLKMSYPKFSTLSASM